MRSKRSKKPHFLKTLDDEINFKETETRFRRGEEICVACLIYNLWGITPKMASFVRYDRKVRKWIGAYKYRLGSIRANSFKRFQDRPDSVRMRLRAAHPCEEHNGYRKYKILRTTEDYVVFGNLMEDFHESISASKNRINQEAVDSYPERLRLQKTNVTSNKLLER